MTTKKLLVGPAGSGKTHRILDQFVETLRAADDPLREDFFLILPSSEHVDRVTSLVLQRGVDGFFHSRITTLNGLIRKIFRVPGEKIASGALRYLMVRQILADPSFDYFSEVRELPGFLDAALHSITELKESLVTAKDFRKGMNLLAKSEPLLAPKYESLANLFEKYEAALAAEGFQDRQGLFREFKKEFSSGEKPKIRFKKIWLDGFFDFSPLQLAYLSELSEMTQEMTVALTEDANGERAELFQAVHDTEKKLKAIGFKPEPQPVCQYRTQKEDLKRLERNLFLSENSGILFPTQTSSSRLRRDCGTRGERVSQSHLSLNADALGEGASSASSESARLSESRSSLEKQQIGRRSAVVESIQIFESVGMQGELEMIAREIKCLLNSDSSVRPSDIAILVRHIGAYEPVIRSVLAQAGIPVEIHERLRLNLAPAIQPFLNLIQIFQNDWKREDLLHFLKSSFVRRWADQNSDSGAISQFELELIRRRIFSGKQYCLDLAKELNVLRPFEMLSQFEDQLIQAKTPAQVENVWRDLWKSFGLLGFSGDLAVRDQQSLKRIDSLLDEIRRHFAQKNRTEIVWTEWAELFVKLVDLDLYSLHAAETNCVQVYDVSLARQKEYRIVFCAGLLERQFPIRVREDPLLSDEERRVLREKADVSLSLASERQSIERYFFYLAVTRAKERLYLTYPRIDREGKQSLPSFYLSEVQQIFQNQVPVRRQELGRPYPELKEAMDLRELELAFAGSVWHDESPEEESLDLLAGEKTILTESQRLLEDAFQNHEAAIQDPEILASSYFDLKRTSSSKLESYARCPFQYFSNYVLRLKDPGEDVNARHQGTVMHHVLEKCFQAFPKDALTQAPDDLIRVLIDKEFAVAIAETPFRCDKPYQRELLIRETKEFLEHLIFHEKERLRGEALQPLRCELNFGSGDHPEYPSMPFKREDGREVQIVGKIDRIDVDPTGKLGLVIDYKRSSSFKAPDLENGIALQLPIYIRAMEAFLKLQPIGGELYNIQKRHLKGFYHAARVEGLKDLHYSAKKLRAEDFDLWMKRSETFIQFYLNEVGRGSVAVRPRDCKDFCPYSAVCRIEKWRREEIREELFASDRTRWPHLFPEKGSA